MAKRVLMVLTSHDMMGISGKKTGNWSDEVATPYYKFKEAGFDVTLATPRGGPAPLDPFSFDDMFMTENTRKFQKDPLAQLALASTLRFNDINANDYAGVFFREATASSGTWPATRRSSGRLKTGLAMRPQSPWFVSAGDPARRQECGGEPLVKGKDVTGFTDAEDEEIDLSRHLLFSLEKALTANGGNFRRSNKNWLPNVVEDGALLTGQNPASASPIADALVARLR